MIVTRQKPFEVILKELEDAKKVFRVGAAAPAPARIANSTECVCRL